MKIGEIKVKRNYQIAQMVLDAVAVIIIIVIVRSVFAFGEEIERLNNIIQSGNSEISGLIVWQWNIIWIAAAAVITVVSLVMIYKPKKIPKKYTVNSDNAQKYSDIFITAVTCVRIPILLAVFEGMCIHQSVMMRQYNVFTLQIPLDILLTLIIVRFSIHRVKAIQPMKEDKEIVLRED